MEPTNNEAIRSTGPVHPAQRRFVATMCAIALLFSGCAGSGAATTTSEAPPVSPVVTPGESHPDFDRFAAEMDTLRERLRIPGMSVAVVHDQELVWAEGFGYADVAAAIPATADTSYHLASVTKPLAAVVLMQLVEEGALSLDDTVDQYGVDLDRAGEIEVRHLLTQTSHGVPGSEHEYNGNRYAELGKVIEAVTGRSFRSVMYERLIAPLGMTGTSGNHAACNESVPDDIAAGEAVVRRDMARPYQLDGDHQVVESLYPTPYSPAAGLISSVVDLATFDIALDEGRLLDEATKAEMLTPAVATFGSAPGLHYGLGWYVQDFEGTRLEWHYGRWPPSVSALYLRVPEHGLTFIVLANTPNLSTPFPVGTGNVMTSTPALAFYREFVFPLLHEAPLSTVDWEADETELVAQLGAIADDAGRRFVQRELASYQSVFYSVGRADVVERLEHVRAAVFPDTAPTAHFTSAAEDSLGPRVEMSDADLERFVGIYTLDAGASEWPADLGEEPPASVLVTLEEGGLIACTANEPPTILIPVGETRFRSLGGPDLDVDIADGVVRSLTAVIGDAVNLVYVPASSSHGETPVVVDTDMGGDDLMALLYLLGQGSARVLAVSVTGTGLAHCPAGGANARAALDHLGYESIPVACGATSPLAGSNAFLEDWRKGADELGSQLGLDMPAEVDSGAVALLIEAVTSSPEPVRLLAIGPLTNVALAIDRDPEMVDNISDIVIMGGAVDVRGSVDPTFEAEWNLWADPVAANRVLQSGVPITLVPLDATNAVPASVFFHDALTEQKATPEAELVYEFFAANPFNLEGGAYFFWDVLAAAVMIDPNVAAYETRRLEVVEEAGSRQGASVDSPNGAEVRVAIGADRRRFEEGFLTALNGGIGAEVEVPSPDVTVRFSGETCTLEGPTTLTAGDPIATVVVKVVNETDGAIAVVFGLHPGVGIEQVAVDATRAGGVTETPAYWELTGVIPAFAAPLTGGSVIGRADLVPGNHAVVCSTEENDLTLAGDVVIAPGTG